MTGRAPAAWATPCPAAPVLSGGNNGDIRVQASDRHCGWEGWEDSRGIGEAAAQDRDLGNYLAFLVSNPSVEFLPLQAQEIFTWLDDATLSCNCPGSVDIVSSYHTDCDASTLAFANGFRDLRDIRMVARVGKTSPYFVSGADMQDPKSQQIWRESPRVQVQPLLQGPSTHAVCECSASYQVAGTPTPEDTFPCRTHRSLLV